MQVSPIQEFNELLNAGNVFNIVITSGSVAAVGTLDGIVIFNETIVSSKTIGFYEHDVQFKIYSLGGVAEVTEIKSNAETGAGISASTLAQFAVPIILPPGNGSSVGLQLSGTTGGFTITTSTFLAAGAQGFAYPQGCYMVIPSGNGIGLTAGTYYSVLTAANAGTLYANTLPAGQSPTLITSPTALSGLTSGAWLTQVTTAQGLVTIQMAGGAMGNNGSCELYIQNAVFQSAGQKTTSVALGGTGIYSADFGGSASSLNGQMLAPRFFNRGNQNNQVVVGSFNTGLTLGQNSGLATTRSQVDLSATQNIVIRGQLAANTDWYSLEAVMIRVNPKP